MEGVINEGHHQFKTTTTPEIATATATTTEELATPPTTTTTNVEEAERQQQQQNELPMLMPSKVGREFVRQYYELLFKAPELLYRFYMNDSTCTHCQSEMVVGKRDIQYLFRRQNHTDCRTKILNTDIHGTLGHGVIVMVTGEQFSAGRPVRPFVQTFVLAAQGPRRYYVYNDIFRYTDFFEKPRSAVEDAECQTSSMHLGDGDQHKYKQQQQQRNHNQQQQQQYHHPQQQQQQQILQLHLDDDEDLEVNEQQQQQHLLLRHDDRSQRHNQETAARVYNNYEKNSPATNTNNCKNCCTEQQQQQQQRISSMPMQQQQQQPEGCAIPMPRWASARQNKEPIVATTFTSFSQQQQQLLLQQQQQHTNNHNECKTINNNQNVESSYDDFLSDGQPPQNPDCPFYRSLIAQALSPRMEFEEVATPLINQYENSNYYNEDVSRVSIGVSSEHMTKRRSECALGLKPTHHALYARDAKDTYPDQAEQHLNTNEVSDNVPTYAKLLMSAFTRASLKNNNHQLASTIATPLKATNMSIFNNNNANKSSDDIDHSNSSLSPPTTMIDSHHGGNYATATPTSGVYTSVQRNNYNTSGGGGGGGGGGGIRRNDRRRASSAQKYDDNQQLFLGQIPHNATEDELINIFSCFGNVLELRILPNLGGKIQPGAKHPLKYGFLTFEHVESVKACLESRPVYFPNNSPDGQKLNVRAKKPSVARDEIPTSCPPNTLDTQSMGNEWLKGLTRRNNSISNSLNVIGGANNNNNGANGSGVNTLNNNNNNNNNNSNNNNNNSNVFNRKDNRNNRAVSLDSGPPPIQGGKKFIQPAGGGGGSGCGRR